jgi:hypothetical protein
MINEFEKWGFDLDNINWINHPNKDEIDDELLNSLIIQGPSYIENPIKEGLFVYPKTNEITSQCHGGTKAATFYLIKNECAKKLIEHYIPFNNAPDWWMNYLFRKLNIRSFWVEPSVVYVQPNHISTCKI